MLPELPPLPLQPLISAIIPAYNAARFLAEAVASIRRQGYPSLEIIVVDDGSSDDTAEHAQRWPYVRLFRQSNRGPAAARNVGIQAARGDVLAFLDADDLWTPDFIATLLPHLFAQPQARFAWGHSRWVRGFHEHGRFHEQQVEHESYSLCLIPAALFRREAFAEVGTFAESLRMAEDSDWVAAARFHDLPNVEVPHTVLIYQRHAESLTGAQPVPQPLVFSMLRQSLGRHRQRQASRHILDS